MESMLAAPPLVPNDTSSPHAPASAFESTREAIEGVKQCAGTVQLINTVGFDTAEGLRTKAEFALNCLVSDAVLPSEADCRIIGLARDCLYLENALDVDLVSSMSECFGGSGTLVWGFSVEIAETIAFGLAAVANTLLRRTMEQAEAALRVENLFSGLDFLSIHIYGGLCRASFEERPLGQASDALEVAGEVAQARLTRAFQGICVWSLTMLCNLMGTTRLTTAALWEVAGGDPLWVSVLVQGVLSFSALSVTKTHAGLYLPVPENLREVKNAVICACSQLGSSSIAFGEEFEADLFADDVDGFTMSERLVGWGLHRARLASAASECGFIRRLMLESTSQTNPQLLVSAVSLLAALLRPLHRDDETWGRLHAQDEECHLDPMSFGEAETALDTLADQVSANGQGVWLHIAGIIPHVSCCGRLAAFLFDCAALAFRVPASHESCACFLEACTVDLAPGNCSVFAGLVAISSNWGLVPEDTVCTSLARCLEAVATEKIVEIFNRHRDLLKDGEVAQRWRTFLKDIFPTTLDQFADAAVLPPLMNTSASQEGRLKVWREERKPGIRQTLRGAPPELCCALDGYLLVDPVRLLCGHVCERGSLAKALEASGGHCPFLGSPLNIAECSRDSEIRLKAARWVKQATLRGR